MMSVYEVTFERREGPKLHDSLPGRAPATVADSSSVKLALGFLLVEDPAVVAT